MHDLVFYDVDSGHAVKTVENDSGVTRLSPDGALVAFGNTTSGDVVVEDLSTGQFDALNLSSCNQNDRIRVSGLTWVSNSSLVVSGNGPAGANCTGSKDLVQVNTRFAVLIGRRPGGQQGWTEFSGQARWRSFGELLVSTDFRSGIDEFRDAAWSAADPRGAHAAVDGSRAIDLRTFASIPISYPKISGFEQLGYSGEFSADGKLLYLVGESPFGSLPSEIVDVRSGHIVNSFPGASGHGALAISPDGTHLAELGWSTVDIYALTNTGRQYR
jgi:hypothetical protein